MIETKATLPLIQRFSYFLIGLSALLALLYIAQGILIPLVFAFIVAILLHPVVNFFIRHRINRIVAISFTLLLMVLFIAAFVALIYSQAVSFSDSWPVLVQRFTDILNDAISYTSTYLNVRPALIHEWITKTQHELLNFNGALIGQTLSNVGSIVAALILIPVYIFVILYYQPLLIEFINRLFVKTHQAQVRSIVTQTKSVVQNYLLGLIIEVIIISILNTSGLLLLGIPYAIFLGVLGALLNLIPYIGGLVAVLLFMIVALVTKSSPWFALYVCGFHLFIQFVDNDFIVPKIVASKVKINALFSILVVLVGNALWGIPGMFLSLPLLAILKVVFDHVDSMKPWGYLLGDTMPAKRRKKLGEKK